MFGSTVCPRRKLSVFLIAGAYLLLVVAVARGTEDWHAGLVGAWYHGDDLTRVGTCMRIMDLEQIWDANRGRGNNWSAQWVGFITAPADGLVTFCAKSNKEFILAVNGRTLLHVAPGAGQGRGSVSLVKGKKYPIHVTYLQHVAGTGRFSVTWSWAGQPPVAVSPEALCFSAAQARFWNYVEKPGPDDFDFTTLRTIPVVNYFAYREAGRFGGWPANNGAWTWDNEILVGFHRGYHDRHPGGGHAILGDRPQANVLARSLDGGKTWTVEDPENFVEDDGLEKTDCPGVNFAHPGFAMRVDGHQFFVSSDRGKHWQGPYRFKGLPFDDDDLTARTDYLVQGPRKCLIFLSAETGLVESNYQDRCFCARTTDGGRSFTFLGWMTHDTEVRSVMPSTVYVGDRHLISAMRRKHEQRFEGRPSITRNWIEAAESRDDGKTWRNLGKVADTDLGERNGNPPALVRLSDGRLCVAYGYRAFPFGIRVKASDDNGRTWGEDLALRADGATWDLGYPRMVVRPDGKVVTMYYYTTKSVPAQHIAVSVWDPDALDRNVKRQGE